MEEEELIKSYDKLVKKLAKKYFEVNISQEDLIQEGYRGLLFAIRNYDSSKGTKLITYAYKIINGYMLNAINTQSRMIALPKHLQVAITDYLNSKRKLYEANNKDFTLVELSELLNIPLDKVEKYEYYKEDCLFYNYSYFNIDKSFELDNDVYYNNYLSEITGDDIDIADKVIDCIMQEEVVEFLDNSSLKELEKIAIKLKFGFGDEPMLNFVEIGKRLGRTSMGAQYLINTGLKKLRKEKNVNKFADYIGARTLKKSE